MLAVDDDLQALRHARSAARRVAVGRRGRGGGGDRPQRLRQDHAAPLHQSAGGLRAGHGDDRWRPDRLPARSPDRSAGAHVGARDRRGARKRRHGVPELQSVSPHECAAEHHGGAGAGEGHPASACRGTGARTAGDGGAVGQGGGVSGAAVRRTAAAGGDRARAGDGSEDHDVRRGDVRARSRACGRGVGGHAAACACRHDDGGGDARDELRPRHRRSHRVHG